jgi:hypothetical protein
MSDIMSERHTVDFIRGSINILSNGERGTITLQFEKAADGLKPISRILKALERRYGVGVMRRLSRWRTGESNPFVLPLRTKPHPENPDVLCFEIGVKQGERMESALAALIEFLRRQPGYQRTFGSPLDRDQMPSRVRKASSTDNSNAAHNLMKQMMER